MSGAAGPRHFEVYDIASEKDNASFKSVLNELSLPFAMLDASRAVVAPTNDAVLGLFKARCAEYGLKEKPYEGTDNFTLTKQERARRPRKSAVHDKGASDAAGKDQPKEQAKEAQETQKQAPASGQAGEKEAGVSTARGASPPPSSSTARAPETPPKGGSPSRTVVINATPSNRTPTPGRPEHTAMVARRLIAGSLGLKVEASPEVKERERQQLEREKARREALRAEQASSK